MTNQQIVVWKKRKKNVSDASKQVLRDFLIKYTQRIIHIWKILFIRFNMAYLKNYLGVYYGPWILRTVMGLERVLKLTGCCNQIPCQFPTYASTPASFLSSNLADYALPKNCWQLFEPKKQPCCFCTFSNVVQFLSLVTNSAWTDWKKNYIEFCNF